MKLQEFKGISKLQASVRETMFGLDGYVLAIEVMYSIESAVPVWPFITTCQKWSRDW